MSKREEIQDEIVGFLEQNINTFNAPYGVLTGLRSLPKGGKVREISFGVARYFDGTIQIWSEKNITVSGRGPLVHVLTGNFKSVTELKEKFSAILPKDER